MKQERIGWIIFYVSMSVVVAWVILKITGVIRSPLYQEIIPTIGFIIAIFSLGFTVGKPIGRIESKVDRIGASLYKLGKDFKDHMNKHHE